MRGRDPIGAKLSACPGRCAAWSIKGVYARLRGLWRNDALQTRDRYTHRLRDGPGPAVHRFAIARAAPHPGHVRPYLSAYGVKPAHPSPWAKGSGQHAIGSARRSDGPAGQARGRHSWQWSAESSWTPPCRFLRCLMIQPSNSFATSRSVSKVKGTGSNA